MMRWPWDLSQTLILQPLVQAEEREDRHDDNDQAHEIDNAIHDTLPESLVERANAAPRARRPNFQPGRV